MNLFLLKILLGIFKFLSYPFMLLPIKNKITIISRMSDKKTIDILLLEQELKQKYSNYKIVVLTNRLESKIEGKLKEKAKYILKMPKYLINIYTSKLVICDCYMPIISLIKKKRNTKIIQMWHAMGAYKKFGYSCLNSYEGFSKEMAKLLKLHKNYDYVFASSEYARDKFSEAFNINKEKILISLLPRYKYLNTNYKNMQTEIYNQIPIINNNKKNIIYAPTFRKSKRSYYKDLIKNIDYEKYNLIIKKHCGDELIYVDKKKIYEAKRKYDLKFLCVSDIVITDYSAITFDALSLNKNIYFYVPDYDKYLKERGIYGQIDGGKYYKEIKDLLKDIDKSNSLNKEKYIDTSSDEIILFIEKILKGEIK